MAECNDSSDRSPSSSMDSSTHPALSTTSSACRPAARGHVSTDLRLGLSLSASSSCLQPAECIPSTPRSWACKLGFFPGKYNIHAWLFGYMEVSGSSCSSIGRSPFSIDHAFCPRMQHGAHPDLRNQVPSDWPPIKPFLRSTLTTSAGSARRLRTLFVKVYMEGVPIGRKLDLLLLDGYDGLLVKLCHMFKSPITYADVMGYHLRIPREKAAHVLTYEDQDGDWMMVGDVPWELFLTIVKKLRIARTDKC